MLTPNGLPIENFTYATPAGSINAPYTTPLDLTTTSEDLSRDEDGTWTYRSVLDGTWHADTPDGWYLIHTELYVQLQGRWVQAQPAPRFVHIREPWKTETTDGMFLRPDKTVVSPPIRIGRPAEPRLPVAMFLDTPDEARPFGLLSEEDQRHVMVSNRFVAPGSVYILPPGDRSLEISLVTEYPRRRFDVAWFNANPPIPIARDKGSIRYRIVNEATGRAETLGPFEFRDLDFRPDYVRDEDEESNWPRYDFAPGSYAIEVEGELYADGGLVMKFGGHYPLRVGTFLSYSTPAKPGSIFFPGSSYPVAVMISPPVPADVRVDFSFVPADPSAPPVRKIITGTADERGFFLPNAPIPELRFGQPGEYRVVVDTSYTDGRGHYFFGTQGNAGLVSAPDDSFTVHGLKYPLTGRNDELPARGHAEREGRRPLDDTLFFSTFNLNAPYYSGDMMAIGGTEPLNVIDTLFCLSESEPTSYTRDVWRALPDGYLSMVFPRATDGAIEGDRHWLQMLPLIGIMPPLLGPPDRGQTPFFFTTRNGFHPFDYPEFIRTEAYVYASSITPGALCNFLVSDSFPFAPYWVPPVDGSIFYAHEEAMLYRYLAAGVIRGKDDGAFRTGVYASGGVIEPPGMNANRVFAPESEPVGVLGGEPFYSVLATATSKVYPKGTRLVFGGFVIPTVPSDVTFEVTAPDGTKSTYSRRSNRLGELEIPKSDVYVADTPGVLRVRAVVHGEHEGRDGYVYRLGKDHTFFDFVMSDHCADIVSLDVPTLNGIFPGDTYRITGRVNPDIEDVHVYYTLMFPGAILDEDELEQVDGGFELGINALDLAMEYPMLMLTSRDEGVSLPDESVFLAFFAQGVSEGKTITQAIRILFREGHAQPYVGAVDCAGNVRNASPH